MAKIELFYFSGTGNSLFVAKKLQSYLPGSMLIPVIHALKNDAIISKADIVGFLFPIYLFTMPAPLKEFLERADLSAASYIFSIATRAGSPCGVFKKLNAMLNRKGKSLDLCLFLNMPNNQTFHQALDSEDEVVSKFAITMKKMDLLSEKILKKEKYWEKDPHGNVIKEKIKFPLLGYFLSSKLPEIERNFYPDAKCSGCGVCEKVCLAKKIRLKNGKPEWRENIKCYYCLACLNYCPMKSIQIKKSNTHASGRYHHPEISAEEIARQKS